MKTNVYTYIWVDLQEEPQLSLGVIPWVPDKKALAEYTLGCTVWTSTGIVDMNMARSRMAQSHDGVAL